MSTTTVTVRFAVPGAASAANAHLSAEIDSRDNGLNGGKTSFSPGEDVYILVYKSSNVSIVSADASAGSVAPQGSTVVTVTEDLTYAGQNTSQLAKPSNSGLSSSKWLGNNLGSLTVGADQVTVTAGSASDTSVGVAKVTYETTALIYKLSSPLTVEGEDEFTIAVLIIGDVTTS